MSDPSFVISIEPAKNEGGRLNVMIIIPKLHCLRTILVYSEMRQKSFWRHLDNLFSSLSEYLWLMREPLIDSFNAGHYSCRVHSWTELSLEGNNIAAIVGTLFLSVSSGDAWYCPSHYSKYRSFISKLSFWLSL